MNSQPQLSDTSLIHAFQQGNNHAFEMLLGRHKDRVYTSILFLVKDKYLAEDIFQDVFMKMVDTLRNRQYNEEGKFLPWALRIAHNLCIDHFRKVQRKPAIVTSTNTDIFELIGGHAPSQEEVMIRRQQHQELHELLALLPCEQREVVVLRHFAEMSFKEIAAITNCSINTALGRMRYALINLRKMMDKQVAVA